MEEGDGLVQPVWTVYLDGIVSFFQRKSKKNENKKPLPKIQRVDRKAPKVERYKF